MIRLSIAWFFFYRRIIFQRKYFPSFPFTGDHRHWFFVKNNVLRRSNRAIAVMGHGRPGTFPIINSIVYKRLNCCRCRLWYNQWVRNWYCYLCIVLGFTYVFEPIKLNLFGYYSEEKNDLDVHNLFFSFHFFAWYRRVFGSLCDCYR